MPPLKSLASLLLMASLSLATPCLADAPAGEPSSNPVLPVPRDRDYDWMKLSLWNQMHADNVAVAAKGDVDILLLGDSITMGLRDSATWNKALAGRKVANFGIGGDRTQNLLWRLDNGEIGKLQPKVVSLLVGTNNIGTTTDDLADTARGVEALVAKLHQAFPKAKLVVHGIFPRGEKADNPDRAKINAINDRLRRLADGCCIHFLDIGKVFLDADGTLSLKVSADHLHLTEEGMRRWAEATVPTLLDLAK